MVGGLPKEERLRIGGDANDMGGGSKYTATQRTAPLLPNQHSAKEK